MLLLIIGGLISLFRRKEGEQSNETSERREQTSQDQQSKRSPFEDFIGKIEEALSDDSQEETVQPTRQREATEQTVSAHDQRMEQMQQLSEQIESGEYQERIREKQPASELRRQFASSDVHLNRLERKLRSDVKKRLSKKSLIDSIIMAEVLGEPRSRKPYENRNLNRHKLY